MRSSVIAPISPHRPALERPADERLELTLFGTLAARYKGAAVPLRLPQQAVRLLAYLLLNRGRAQTREHVAFTLWPDDDEADARANLRRKLHLLQRALPENMEPWILTTATTVAWNTAAPYRLDVAEFELLSGVAESLADADALYAGDLLAGLYDDWIERERERLRTIATDTLLALLSRHQTRRDYSAAIRYGLRLRAIDPWREDAVRALIALRYEAGDRAGALGEFERFRAALAAEMGVEPMPETVCVYERVLGHADAAGAPGPSTLGTDAPRLSPGLPFVSRKRELDELRAAWKSASAGNGTSVLVVGEAGIGKTRLVDEFATFAASNGGRVLRGGTTPFELTPYQAFSEALRSALPILRETPIEPVWLAALAALVPQLNVAFPGLARSIPLDAEPERMRLFEAFDVVVAALASARPTVLILEDLHWAGAATIALFEHLARRASLSRLLILASYREEDVSRAHPLRMVRRILERERLLQITALGPLDIAAIEEMVAQLVDDESSHRASVARYLRDSSDGNPFFLGEVVANDRESGIFDAAARHWTRPEVSREPSLPLTATLKVRLERLSAAARSVAEIAAVIGRSFSAELVRDVSGISERSILDSLGELIDRRLVREVGAAGADFAFSHQLIQQTVYSGMAPEARSRRHRRVGDVIEEIYSEQIEQHPAELASHFDRGGEAEHAAEYYCLAARHALTLHGTQEAKTLAERGNELTHDPATRFRAVEVIEEASSRLGDRESQRNCIAQLDALARELDDPEMLREALRRKIALAHDCGERVQERDAIAELEGKLYGAGAPWGATFAQLKGSYLIATGSYREARTVLSNALKEVSAQDYPRIYVACWCALVELASFESRVADVRVFLDEAPNFDQLYDIAQVVTLFEAACGAARKLQDHAALATCAQRLLDCSHAIGYREGEASAHRFAGLSALRLFEIDRARTLLERAIEMFSSIGQRLKTFQALIDIADLATTIGQFDEAIKRLEDADSIAQAISYGFGRVACANNISYVAYLKGNFELARSSARRALDAAQLIEAPSALAHALVSIGVAERELDDLDAAIAHLEQGTALERKHDETLELVEDLCELVIALLRHNGTERAIILIEEVLALAEHTAHRLSRPQYLFWTVAAVRRAAGDDSGARAMLTRARRALDDLEAVIPDVESRGTFRSLRHNRAIDDAFDHDHWQV